MECSYLLYFWGNGQEEVPSCEAGKLIKVQAPVVQTQDSAILWINHYPLDNSIGFASVYPLDSNLSGGQRYLSFEQLGPAI